MNIVEAAIGGLLTLDQNCKEETAASGAKVCDYIRWSGESSLPQRNYLSQIPIEQMVALMDKYGPETFQKRSRRSNHPVTDLSIRRKFSRWFPRFFERFERRDDGTWHPILGEQKEIERRTFLRKRALLRRKQRFHGGSVFAEALHESDAASSVAR